MKEHRMTLPQIALIAATRGMLGAGIGLLLAGRLKNDQRQAVGWTLVGVGLVTTVPLLLGVINDDAAHSSNKKAA